MAPPPDDDNTGEDSDSKYGTGRTRYLALKERRSRLARSRSSHNFGNEDDDLDEPVSPTTASPSAYLASRCDVVFVKFLYNIKYLPIIVLLFLGLYFLRFFFCFCFVISLLTRSFLNFLKI